MSNFPQLQEARDAAREDVERLTAEIKKVCTHPKIQTMYDDQIMADMECLECGAWLCSYKLDMSKYKPSPKLKQHTDTYWKEK